MNASLDLNEDARLSGRLPRGLALTVAGATLLTAVPLVFPAVRLVSRGAAAQATIDTAAGVIALVAAFLFYGRFGRSGRLADLTLLAALGVLTFSNLVLSALPLASGWGDEPFAMWAPTGGRLLCGALLVAAALAADRPVPRKRFVEPAVLLTSAGTVAAIAATVALLADHLPAVAGVPRVASLDAGLSEHPTTLIAQFLDLALYSVAALGFVHRSRKCEDSFLSWFAIGAVLAAFARLNYVLFPATYSEIVGSGDILRLLFSVALLIGVFREIALYQENFAERAVLDERRRVARELHDGLTQELAFLASYGRLLAKRGASEPGGVQPLIAAAERALSESRELVRDLARPPRESFDEAVAQAARDVAERAGVGVRLELDPEAVPDAPTRHALVRIVREAVTNAVKHACAQEVAVCLAAGPHLEVSVRDDGIGFDPVDVDGAGYGLVSMRERVEALGGSLLIESEPGHGTTVKVIA